MKNSEDLWKRIHGRITVVYRKKTWHPWDEGPARAFQFEKLFRETLPDWPLRNLTDLEHGTATVLSFLLHPGHYIGVPTRDGMETLISRLGGDCYHALLEISHLGPFARLRFTRETLKRSTRELRYSEQERTFRDEDCDFLDQLNVILDESGIEVLDNDILDEVVLDVHLDITKQGEATVYHCLFDE